MKPTILLTLLDAGDLEQAELQSVFRGEGFRPLFVTGKESPRRAVSPPPWAAVLFLGQFDLVRAEKALAMIRDHLGECGGNPSHVIACGWNLNPKDEAALRDSGAAKVAQPVTWEAGPVAERVLAAVYGGFIDSRDGKEVETFVEFEEGEKPYLECAVPYKLTTETHRMVGHTRIMRELRTDIKAYGSSRDPVLIRGATGTGKELIASAIHSAGPADRAKDFIPINIAELGEDVLTSELFGHVKGAFTGAVANRKGLLEEAGDGTLFIDEIGDLDPRNQARLLRVFVNRQIRPVGASYRQRAPFNARLIFATHRNLERMCVEGQFRQDLYQRLREGDNLEAHALSKRRGDLELLAKEFFREWKGEPARREADIFAMKQSDYDKIGDLCVGHKFSGNVRGLRGILRACFSDSLRVKRFDIKRLRSELEIEQQRQESTQRDVDGDSGLNLATITFDPSGEKYRKFKERAVAEYFTQVYRAAEKNLERASAVADVSEKTFRNYLPNSELDHKRNKQKATGGDSEYKGGTLQED